MFARHEPRADERPDTDALVFGVKFVMVLLLLFAAAHFGTSTLAMQWFAASVVDERAHAHLASVREATEETRPTYVRAAYASGVPAPRAREYSLTSVIAEYEKVIYIDRTTMNLYLIVDGATSATYPILSIPRAGAGGYLRHAVYPVVDRTTDQYSSIAGVHFPYAVRFSEHLMIHGWPYQPGGTPVSASYVGSGVRLASRDAARVFQFADEKTVVYVNGGDSANVPTLASIELRERALPSVGSIAYALADIETGEILLERNGDANRAIASITKLMTGVIAQELIDDAREIPVRYRGVRYTSFDLLYPLMLRSDNSVSNEYAAFLGTEHFIDAMNAKARTLGMESTSFADPSGLSRYNRSTARDLIRLARYLYTDHEALLAVSKQPSMSIYDDRGRAWVMTNQNRYAGDAYFIGGKLGFTDEARRTGLSIAAVPVGDEVRTVAIAVLGSNDWKRDTDLLIDWLKRSGEPGTLARP